MSAQQPWWLGDPVEPAEPAGPRAGDAHAECYACPVGGLFASLEEQRPELLEHLLRAAEELVVVARGALDAAEAAIQRSRRTREPGPARVRRIDID